MFIRLWIFNPLDIRSLSTIAIFARRGTVFEHMCEVATIMKSHLFMDCQHFAKYSRSCSNKRVNAKYRFYVVKYRSHTVLFLDGKYTSEKLEVVSREWLHSCWAFPGKIYLHVSSTKHCDIQTRYSIGFQGLRLKLFEYFLLIKEIII